VGDHARNQLIAEVIAFANAYGGTLVLGIRETDNKPARAGGITPVPRCIELAERLRLQCRDCIEPQVPLLELAGVPTEDDGTGVVVIRVPRSRMAPHRHTVTRECYIRRADRTEKMTMREIQDLTLQVERGLAAIKARFEARREDFAKQLETRHGRAYGLRATLIPLAPVYIERVHSNDAARPPLHSFSGTSGNGGPYELFLPHTGYPNWRPILRGTQTTVGNENFLVLLEAHCDGLVEYMAFVKGRDDQPFQIFAGWFMGLICNVLCAAERFRQAADAPEVEYGLELEITTRASGLLIGRYGGSRLGDRLGPFPVGQTIFPRYSVGPTSEFQTLSALIERDFWHAAGHDSSDPMIVDFAKAFHDLGFSD
jgi:hypothetical protein